MTDFSVDLQSYNGEEDDTKDEEEREQQLNGILSTYFDDLSSLSDDSCASDDLSKSEEDEENELHPLREIGPAVRDSFEASWPKFKAVQTSTPLYSSDHQRRHFAKTDVIAEIDEIDSCDLKVNGNCNSLEVKSNSSIENGRDASTRFRKSNIEEDIGLYSSKHQQMLLDENENLTKELTTLKHQLSVRSGDYEGIRHKYSELEKAFQEKDSEIIQLNGKISALEVQLRLETEAKEKFCRKLAIAEATIEPLQRQLSEFAKSDNLVRIREAHEAYVSKIKNDYENEIFALNEEITKLKWDIESKKYEAPVNKISSPKKSENDPAFERILMKKEQQISSLENEIKQLTDTIANLKTQLSMKQTEITPITITKNTVAFDSTVCDLKTELENALETLETRREQNNALRLQLDTAKNEVNVLKERLRAKEKETKCELDKALTTSKLQHDTQLTALNKEITSLKKVNTEVSQKVNELIEYKDKCTELEIIVDSLKSDLNELKASYAQICNEKMEIEAAYTRFLKDIRKQIDFSDSSTKKLKEMVNISTELWKKEVEVKYAEQLNQELKKIRNACEEEKAAEVTRISQKLNKDMEDQVVFILNASENMVQNKEFDEEAYSTKCHTLFKPLLQFWVNLRSSYKEGEAMLAQKTSELRLARQRLEEALIESQRNKNDTVDTCNYKEVVDDLNQQLRAMNEKIKKYKKHYFLLQKKHETEVNQLKLL